ncbi:hypothetical protein R3P38DRAFT_2888627 [Favolaschia claudopus]|uniref:ZZ-type domain-containing protein n=1 Tax=Favolaschia claudopus TaxID=2862362 RepID=A0AAW0CTP9_9AGAR
MAPGYFGCNACLRAIPSTEPRVHCLECDGFDLCSVCALGVEESVGEHRLAHRTRVFRRSGGGVHPAVSSSGTMVVYRALEESQTSQAFSPLPPLREVSTDTPLPALPPLPSSSPPISRLVASTPQTGGIPAPPVLPPRQSTVLSPQPTSVSTASFVDQGSIDGAAAHTVPARDAPQDPELPQLSGVSSRRLGRSSLSISSLPQSKYKTATPPPAQAATVAQELPPPRSDSPQAPSMVARSAAALRASTSTPPPPPPPPSTGWGPFFNPDMSPTPVFLTLVDAIFNYLDIRRTGNLTPEVYSSFLTNQGYVGNQNIWHSNLVASMGKSKEECADAALKRAFDLFGIQYLLRSRAREPTSPPADVKRQLQSFGASFARALTPSTPAAGTMPLLTRAGFLNITAIEVLCDPSRHHTGLARIVQMYDLGPVRAWGVLPRDVLANEPDPRMLERIARVQAAARERQSAHARSESVGAAAATGLRSAASLARTAVDGVGRIDPRDAVNVIQTVGETAYLVNRVSDQLQQDY